MLASKISIILAKPNLDLESEAHTLCGVASHQFYLLANFEFLFPTLSVQTTVCNHQNDRSPKWSFPCFRHSPKWSEQNDRPKMIAREKFEVFHQNGRPFWQNDRLLQQKFNSPKWSKWKIQLTKMIERKISLTKMIAWQHTHNYRHKACRVGWRVLSMMGCRGRCCFWEFVSSEHEMKYFKLV